MPPPTTVTAYRLEAKTLADQAVTSLQAQLVQSNLDVTTTQVALAAATKAVADDQATNASLRVQLSQAALPSDAANLVTELQANMIQSRIDQAALGAATDAASAATRAQQDVITALAAAQTAQAQAAADLVASQAADTVVAQWTTTVNGPAVTAALSSAAPAAVNPMVAAATTALEKIIGSGMLALFEHRRTDFEADQAAAQAALDLAHSSLAGAQTAQQPLVGAVTSTGGAYQAARATLADLAENAVKEATAALATLTGAALVGTPAGSIGPLPADELAALAAARGAANSQITPESKVFTAKGKVRTDQANIDTTTLTALEANPDFDGATDASTQADRTKLTTDQGTLTTALGAVDEAALGAWEVLIPAPVMALVVAVVEAESTLARLGAVTVGTVLGDLTTAESNYAAALNAQLTYQRSTARLNAELARRQADHDAAAPVASQREDAAIRGVA